jgi:hypothetical protein
MSKGCTFNLDTSSPSNPPHLIDANNNIILPVMVGSSRTITLNTDDKVAVGCLGPGNYIKATGMQLAPATCTSTSKLLLVDGQELSYSQLGCLSQNKEILLENGTCANGPGTVIRMGWKAGPEFIPLYDTCHDKVAAANYFSTHIIHGKSAMAPDGDFIDAGSQDATYYFMNTAPQWQNFNGANWKYIIILLSYIID